MSLHLENSPRTAGTRRLLIGLAAVTGLVCGAGGALAQGQRTRQAPPTPPPAPSAPSAPATASAPTPPPAPSALAHRLFTIGGGPSSYVYKSNEDGREVELRLDNNQIVTAKVDGEDVPKDRIIHEGNSIVFKDDKGEVIFEHTVSQPREIRITASLDPLSRTVYGQPLSGTNVWRGQATTIPGPDDNLFVEAEPPKVMLGVTMMEPDASLRGHLGLEPGTTTLVGSVYEGLPADAAGLEPYDIIVAINGNKPASADTIRKALREMNPGDEVKLTVIHRGKEREAAIKLEKYDRERFNEEKVKKMAMVADEASLGVAQAMDLRNRYGQSLGGGMVGIAPDPNSPNAIFLSSPAVNTQLMEQALLEAQAKMEEQIAKAQDMAKLAGDKSAQVKSMEERMRRMEELLEKLLEDRQKKEGGGGGGAGAEPVPEELLPSRGIWAAQNPAA